MTHNYSIQEHTVVNINTDTGDHGTGVRTHRPSTIDISKSKGGTT